MYDHNKMYGIIITLIAIPTAILAILAIYFYLFKPVVEQKTMTRGDILFQNATNFSVVHMPMG
jgi:hypothetical protein